MSASRAAGTQPLRQEGFTLLEVVVALAIVAVVALALVGWQAAGLRAARSAVQTRELAAALRYETTLARLVATGAVGGCRSEYAFASCTLTTTCLDTAGAAEGCALIRTTVELTVPEGRTVTATTVGYSALESAPTAPPPDPADTDAALLGGPSITGGAP